jgi:hypothetical protein
LKKNCLGILPENYIRGCLKINIGLNAMDWNQSSKLLPSGTKVF